MPPTDIPETPKKEIDMNSFLQVEHQRLTKLFEEHNAKHRVMLKEADMMRDEILRIDGAIKNISALIVKVKETLK